MAAVAPHKQHSKEINHVSHNRALGDVMVMRERCWKAVLASENLLNRIDQYRDMGVEVDPDLAKHLQTIRKLTNECKRKIQLLDRATRNTEHLLNASITMRVRFRAGSGSGYVSSKAESRAYIIQRWTDLDTGIQTKYLVPFMSDLVHAIQIIQRDAVVVDMPQCITTAAEQPLAVAQVEDNEGNPPSSAEEKTPTEQ